MNTSTSAPEITEELCESFSAAYDALLRRRAGDIAEQSISNFVALQWMDWHGGSLRVTPLGQMALLRIRARMQTAAA